MSAEPTTTDARRLDEHYPAPVVRLWPAIAFVTIYWAAHVVVGRLDKPYFFGFIFGMASAALLVLPYFGWWWTRRGIPRSDRLFGFLAIVVGGVVAGPLVDKSVGKFGVLFTGLPIVLTAWTVWLIILKMTSMRRRRLCDLVVVALAWAILMPIRMDGLNSDLKADIRWRWSPTAEDLFRAEKSQVADRESDSQPTSVSEATAVVRPGDWPEFRGPDRDGVIRGVSIATDWDAKLPRQLWRRRVGPAWSSVIVIGNRLFTQEQRGEQEAVVCYEAATGRELWSHEDTSRFWESVSGAGPRATPTFANGRIYALGGTGTLNSLDAVSGKRLWACNIASDTGTRLPMWGYVGSPLVVDGLVIVFAGGAGDKNLLAYRADSGEPVWSAAVGQSSYSSPQLATLAGTRQCLMFTDLGLSAVDPATGAVLWKTGAAMPGAPRPCQPHVLGATEVVVPGLEGFSMSLLDVTRDGDAWKVSTRWTSTQVKPEFPDFVVHQGHAYGFDVNIFCCIELATGKRHWKEGRYGRGQVMLLADQGILLVVSETGEAILLAADSDHHKELARVQAVIGKTWSHPVIAHGRLFVRNAEEMACYELTMK